MGSRIVVWESSKRIHLRRMNWAGEFGSTPGRLRVYLRLVVVVLNLDPSPCWSPVWIFPPTIFSYKHRVVLNQSWFFQKTQSQHVLSVRLYVEWQGLGHRQSPAPRELTFEVGNRHVDGHMKSKGVDVRIGYTENTKMEAGSGRICSFHWRCQLGWFLEDRGDLVLWGRQGPAWWTENEPERRLGGQRAE